MNENQSQHESATASQKHGERRIAVLAGTADAQRRKHWTAGCKPVRDGKMVQTKNTKHRTDSMKRSAAWGWSMGPGQAFGFPG
jgi:hypothetical protein